MQFFDGYWITYLSKNLVLNDKRAFLNYNIFFSFIWSTWDDGWVSNMLAKLELQDLQPKRSGQKLIFRRYKVVEGLVPAIEPDKYLKKHVLKEQLLPKQWQLSDNKYCGKTSYEKNPKCFEISSSKTPWYSNSFL